MEKQNAKVAVAGFDCPGPDQGDAESGPPARIEPCCVYHFPLSQAELAQEAEEHEFNAQFDDMRERMAATLRDLDKEAAIDAMDQAEESHKAAGFSPVAARMFVLAGHAIFTVQNTKTGGRFTFKVSRAANRAAGPHFVSVLTGSDNNRDYSYLGTIFQGTDYRHGRKSHIGKDAPSAVAFAWLWALLRSGKPFPPSLRVHHESRCGRCGRRLTVPESIATGFGPDCAEMM